jgi:hypothetical protein
MGTIYPPSGKTPSALIISTHTDSSNMLRKSLSLKQLLL